MIQNDLSSGSYFNLFAPTKKLLDSLNNFVTQGINSICFRLCGIWWLQVMFYSFLKIILNPTIIFLQRVIGFGEPMKSFKNLPNAKIRIYLLLNDILLETDQIFIRLPTFLRFCSIKCQITFDLLSNEDSIFHPFLIYKKPI